MSNRTPGVKDLVFGASGIGCLYRDVPADEARATLEAALSAGIDYVDTAPWYGAGLSERRVGELLKAAGSGATVSTKCGRVTRPLADVTDADCVERHYIGHFITEAYHSDIPVALYTGEGVRESFRQSCERLQCTRLQCLRLHDAETEARFEEATRSGGAVEAMLELKSQGLVNEVGLGMGSSEFALRYLRRYPQGTFDSLMLAGCWNLLDQNGLEVLLECQRLGVRVFNVGIFASGVLWGSTCYKYEEVPSDHVKVVLAEKWRKLAERHGVKLPQVALAFALLPDVVERAAIGCSTPEEVARNVEFCGLAVPGDLWAEAAAQGLMPLQAVPPPSAQ